MSITYIGNRNADLTKDNSGNIKTAVIMLYHFNAGESPVAVLKDENIPAIGAVHDDNPALSVSDIKISAPQEGDEKSGAYEVTVNYAYTPSVQAGVGGAAGKKPWELGATDVGTGPIEVVVPFVKGYKPSGGDKVGSPSIPVLNPVGDPYEESTVRQHIILRFAYCLKTFNVAWYTTYISSVNADAATICGCAIAQNKGCIKSLSADYQEKYDDTGTLEYSYWKVNVEIEVAPEGWTKEIMCRGLYFLEGGKKYRIYTDGKGNYGKKSSMGNDAEPVDEPQKLTLTGAIYTGTDAKYQPFYDHPALSWAALNFPKKAGNQ